MRAAYNKNMRTPFPRSIGREDQSAQLVSRISELRQSLRLAAPEALAARVDARHLAPGPGRDELHLAWWGAPITITCPDMTAISAQGDSLPAPVQALLLYHLNVSDGAPPTGRWVSFADLPDGRMYAQAFQGYSGNALVKAFDPNVDNFSRAARASGGQPVDVGDAAFAFLPLPRVPLLVTYWLGDDDFPSACKVLFDETATRHLPVDVCAILGGMLAGRIKKHVTPR